MDCFENSDKSGANDVKLLLHYLMVMCIARSKATNSKPKVSFGKIEVKICRYGFCFTGGYLMGLQTKIYCYSIMPNLALAKKYT